MNKSSNRMVVERFAVNVAFRSAKVRSFAERKSTNWGVVSFATAAAFLLSAVGCDRSSNGSATTASAASGQPAGLYRGQLLGNVLHMVNNMANCDEEPALEQVVDRLNQWGRSQNDELDWKPDSLIKTLPAEIRNGVLFENLGNKSYDHDFDGRFLEESAWLRDISRRARGGNLDDLAVAGALFDWTVRNIYLLERPQIAAGAKPTATQAAQIRMIDRKLPADLLLQGNGTMEQRAWVFMLLGRQQGLDIVMLAVADPDHPEKSRPWLPALLHEGQLYLFDTSLGLPIPGPEGNGVATLSQAAEDESVLAALDLDESHHYPVKAAAAKDVRAFIESSPSALSRRMKVLESQLVGEDKMVLTVAPNQIAKRLADVPHVQKEVKLWTLPYQAYTLRLNEQDAPNEIKGLIARTRAPFTIPGYHGDRMTVLKPGERLSDFERMVQEGQTPNQKVSSAVTPGKRGLNARLGFQVKLPNADFEYVSIEFQNDPAIVKGKETVTYDDKDGRRPKIIFKIAEGKTTANDVLTAFSADMVAPQVVDASLIGDSDGEGLVDEGDSVHTVRFDVKKALDIKRPVQIVFPLWAARQLHFRGTLGGESGAKHYYMAARPGTDQFRDYVNELLADHKAATNQDPTLQFARECLLAMTRRKQAATFWLGVVSFEEKQFDAAEDYFKMVPVESRPDIPSFWLNAARYNLARTYEAAGRTADAIKLLEEDESPQRFGNQLRARRLKEAAKTTEAKTDSKTSDSKTDTSKQK